MVITSFSLLYKLFFFLSIRQREAGQDHDHSIEDASITRNFRYMRRKPTIISYQPPPGGEEEPGEPNGELADVVVGDNSDHMILDRISQRPEENLSRHHHHHHEEESETEHAHSLPIVQATSSRVEAIKVEDSASAREAKLTQPLVVYIDGPFGAPTSQIFRAQHAVLIGTGIGVTPFASILQSIMHRYWQTKNTCPKCQYKWTNDLKASVGLNLRKVNKTKKRA